MALFLTLISLCLLAVLGKVQDDLKAEIADALRVLPGFSVIDEPNYEVRDLLISSLSEFMSTRFSLLAVGEISADVDTWVDTYPGPPLSAHQVDRLIEVVSMRKSAEQLNWEPDLLPHGRAEERLPPLYRHALKGAAALMTLLSSNLSEENASSLSADHKIPRDVIGLKALFKPEINKASMVNGLEYHRRTPFGHPPLIKLLTLTFTCTPYVRGSSTRTCTGVQVPNHWRRPPVEGVGFLAPPLSPLEPVEEDQRRGPSPALRLPLERRRRDVVCSPASLCSRAAGKVGDSVRSLRSKISTPQSARSLEEPGCSPCFSGLRRGAETKSGKARSSASMSPPSASRGESSGQAHGWMRFNSVMSFFSGNPGSPMEDATSLSPQKRNGDTLGEKEPPFHPFRLESADPLVRLQLASEAVLGPASSTPPSLADWKAMQSDFLLLGKFRRFVASPLLVLQALLWLDEALISRVILPNEVDKREMVQAFRFVTRTILHPWLRLSMEEEQQIYRMAHQSMKESMPPPPPSEESRRGWSVAGPSP